MQLQTPGMQLQYVCKGGGFVKYYGLKTGHRRMEIWRLRGIHQDWARGEQSPDIITKKRLKHPGL